MDDGNKDVPTTEETAEMEELEEFVREKDGAKSGTKPKQPDETDKA